MIREDNEKDQAPVVNRKTYLRSASWTGHPLRKPTPSKPLWNSKARASLPPLQPLSIIRPNIDEWPKPGSDDLGVWPNPPTPGPKPGSLTPLENSKLPPREFEFRKDKLAFFNKECSRILDHVYLGSDAVAKNREILRQHAITHVLNCVGFVCPEYFKGELVYKTLWLQDCPSEDITSILYDVFDYFEDVRKQGGRVLVHCSQGVSRSTSLVIAYLMWKEGQSFEDAFQHVKAARGVTDPNVGFACQLLQCQKRMHALPQSPSSVLRMYRMAPHSPYDPLHLVPKMLTEAGPGWLDSRGAFVVHVPSMLYVWTGSLCPSVMSDSAWAAASQVVRYERVQGPVVAISEGEETFEFWVALGRGEGSAGRRKVPDYDLDFEIFHGALAGGVVPPFPLSEAETEMCLPARENGWGRLRRKFAIGVVKEFIASSKYNSVRPGADDEPNVMDSCKEVGNFVSSDQFDPLASYVACSPPWAQNNLEEVGYQEVRPDASLTRSPSFNSVGSFLIGSMKTNSTSPALSPVTSDYSSSYMCSPSSNSDSSSVSTQPSLYRLETRNIDPCGNVVLEEDVGSSEENRYLFDNAISPQVRKSGGLPNLPSTDEASRVSEKLPRYLEDDVLMDGECNNCSNEEPILVPNVYTGGDDVLSRLQDEKEYDRTNLLVYKWPSLHKMDTCGLLDSGSVYIILIPAYSFSTRIADLLYVWIGRNVSSKDSYSQLIRNNSKCENSHVDAEQVDCELLVEKGFSRHAHVEIVREGKEPVQLLNHFSHLFKQGHYSGEDAVIDNEGSFISFKLNPLES